MEFRVVLYDTNSEDKYEAENRYEYFGDRDSMWYLWFTLSNKCGQKHVEMFNLAGDKQQPEKGLSGMIGYSI